MPRKETQTDLNSSAEQADDRNLQLRSCADFRLKWTPTQFCKLPSSDRTAILLGLLTSSDPIQIVQVDGGYNFTMEDTPIHGAMPLLYDFNTNKQIAREACEIFYQNNTFVLSCRSLPHLVLDQTDTWIMRGTIEPRLLFRSLRILLDHHEPQTPGSTPVELANLLACAHLDRLDIEMCAPEHLLKDVEGLKEWSVNEAKALGVVVRQLREKFGMAVKVLIGGPLAAQEQEDITWMWDKPSEKLTALVVSGKANESQGIMQLMWSVWSKAD